MIPDYINRLKFKLPLLLLALLGAGIVFYFINLHGAGTSPDSVYYISVARHIAEGKGLTGYDGYALVLQPPLYPALLSVIKILLFTDPLTSAGYVNAIVFGLIVYLSGLLLLKNLKSYTLVLLGTVTVLTSFVFIQIALMALSELLFILLILLYLYFFEKYVSHGNLKSLALLSVVVSLACLTRYIGVVLILTGLCGIIFHGNKSFKEKLKHSIIFLSITCIPIAMWVLRNFYLSGTFTGQRADSKYTFSDNLRFLFNTVLSWFLAAQFNGVQILLFTISAAAIIAVLVVRYEKQASSLLKEIYPELIFVMLYAIMIVISSTTTAYDYIANRLLSPIYIPLFLLTFVLIDRLYIFLSTQFNKKLIITAFALGIILWLIYPMGKYVYIINDYVKLSGIGFSRDYWENKDIIKYLNNNRDLEGKYTIYSNVPEAVYLLSNIQAKWSPAKTMYNSPQIINSSSDLKEMWKGSGKICLVWFSKIEKRQFLYTINELYKSIPMKKIAQLKDGAVYIIENN